MLREGTRETEDRVQSVLMDITVAGQVNKNNVLRERTAALGQVHVITVLRESTANVVLHVKTVLRGMAVSKRQVHAANVLRER